MGLLIPVFLAQHVAGTYLAFKLYDGSIDYNAELLRLYVLAPVRGVEQVVLLIVAWGHGCIGLNYNLQLRRWYPELKWLLFAGALLVPSLALIGFYEGGREVATLALDPAWVNGVALKRPLPPGGAAHLELLGNVMRGAVFGLLAAVLAGRSIRRHLQLRRGAVTLTYPNGRKVRVLTGTSVLEASRTAHIPHAAICGGHGRCSTCRIRVMGPVGAIPEPDESELRVLHAIGAPPNVRLACQLRPTGNVDVTAAAARPMSRPARASARSWTCRAWNWISPSCSATSAPSPKWPSGCCPMTWCSCSTAISPRWAAQSRMPAAGSTNSSVTASWRCSVSTEDRSMAAALP
ncbi:MAG: 2Fe-2S iron-sulfur cluster-binding protein [Aliidongia sp.]